MASVDEYITGYVAITGSDDFVICHDTMYGSWLFRNVGTCIHKDETKLKEATLSGTFIT